MLLSSLVCTFRLSHLETKVIEGVGKTPDIICDLHSQVESFKKKLEVRRGWLEPNKTRHLDPFRFKQVFGLLCGRAWHTSAGWVCFGRTPTSTSPSSHPNLEHLS